MKTEIRETLAEVCEPLTDAREPLTDAREPLTDARESANVPNVPESAYPQTFKLKL
jgi:hypothetical protein